MLHKRAVPISRSMLCNTRKSQLLFIALCFSILIGGCTALNPLLYFEGKSGTKDTLPVAVEELIEFAEYCDEAYENRKENYRVKRGELSYTIKQSDGVTIIVFRGTANLKNVGTDIDLRPFKDDELDAYIHRGFRDAAMFTLDDIKKNYKIEKTVYLTGHSLGGAIAQIIGLWLDNDGYNVQIYTFGSPKVSTTFFGNQPNHYRVTLRNDPVPFMPPYPYVHSGIRIDTKSLNWSVGGEANRGSFGEIDGRDHSIETYLGLIRRHRVSN